MRNPHHERSTAPPASRGRCGLSLPYTLRSTDGNEFFVSRLRPQSIIVNAGQSAARIVVDISPMFALELSTTLRRQAEVLMRAEVARTEVKGAVA